MQPIEKELLSSTKTLTRIREAEDTAWETHVALIRQAVKDHGLTCPQVAKITGVTKARIWQIVNDYAKVSI